MTFKHLVTVATLCMASTSVLAAPMYYGETSSDNITNNQIDTGYYLWSDEDDANSWHIRWSSTNAVPGNRVDWFGNILFEGGGLETVATYQWENHDDPLNVDTGNADHAIDWTAITNDLGGVDGFDFTIDSSLEVLKFELGSTLFDGLGEVSSGQGVAGTNIYIGDGFNVPNVYVTASNNGTYQSFEVDVPEPASFSIFGLGLAGLVLARRKAATA